MSELKLYDLTVAWLIFGYVDGCFDGWLLHNTSEPGKEPSVIIG
jgi:hypothetical protein